MGLVESLLWILGTIFIGWFVYLRFLCLPLDDWVAQKEQMYGKYKPDTSVSRKIMSCTFLPAVEEMLFRGPVLIVLYSHGLYMALFSSVPLAIIFGLAHLSNEFEFGDGTKVNMPPLAIPSMVLGGILCGLAAICTGMLWLPIAMHISWNMSCALAGTVDDKKFINMAKHINKFTGGRVSQGA